MGGNTARKKASYALVAAALVLAVVSIAAGWPPQFIKALIMSPLEVGEVAPQFELESLSGGKVSLSQFEGQAVLLKFWSVG